MDFILIPLDYSRRIAPKHIRRKMVLVPLLGRSRIAPRVPKPKGSSEGLSVCGRFGRRRAAAQGIPVTAPGVEGALPDAQLTIRSEPNYKDCTVLAKFVAQQPYVSVILYIPAIGAFYAACGVFTLPSVAIRQSSKKSHPEPRRPRAVDRDS